MELKYTFLFLLFLKCSLGQCPGKIVPNSDRCYWLTNGEANWYNGNITCFEDGGTPASIPDNFTYRYINSSLGITSSIAGVWIGVNDLQLECNFKNYDGSEPTYLDFLFDTSKGCEGGKDALAIIPADDYTWQEKSEVSDNFIMLCEKTLDEIYTQTITSSISSTEFDFTTGTSTHTASVSTGSTKFESPMTTGKTTKMEQTPGDKILIIGLLVGIGVGVVFVIVIIIIICRRQRSRSPKPNQKHTESKQGQTMYSYATVSHENGVNTSEKTNHGNHNDNHRTKAGSSVKTEKYSENDQYDVKPDGVYDQTFHGTKGNNTTNNEIENTYCMKPEGVYDVSSRTQGSTVNNPRSNDGDNNYGCSSTPESFYDSATQSQKSIQNKSLNNYTEDNYGYTDKPESVYDSANQNRDHKKGSSHELENDYGVSMKPEGVYDLSVKNPQNLGNGDVEDNYGCSGQPDGVYDSAVQKPSTQTTNDFDSVYDH